MTVCIGGALRCTSTFLHFKYFIRHPPYHSHRNLPELFAFVGWTTGFTYEDQIANAKLNCWALVCAACILHFERPLPLRFATSLCTSSFASRNFLIFNVTLSPFSQLWSIVWTMSMELVWLECVMCWVRLRSWEESWSFHYLVLLSCQAATGWELFVYFGPQRAIVLWTSSILSTAL